MAKDKELERFINEALSGSQGGSAKKRKAKKSGKAKVAARYRWDLKGGGLTRIG